MGQERSKQFECGALLDPMGPSKANIFAGLAFWTKERNAVVAPKRRDGVSI
jgi:hypothetical protein